MPCHCEGKQSDIKDYPVLFECFFVFLAGKCACKEDCVKTGKCTCDSSCQCNKSSKFIYPDYTL
jgi:hypothetical protein